MYCKVFLKTTLSKVTGKLNTNIDSKFSTGFTLTALTNHIYDDGTIQPVGTTPPQILKTFYKMYAKGRKNVFSTHRKREIMFFSPAHA